MATLNIGGKRVKVGDEFLRMSPEQQNAAVEEIAGQMGASAVPSPSLGPATPPAGLRPGTREYADWAGEQARAGNKLPQVSNPNPEQPWDAPGSLVPIQFQQGTGNARLAMPSLITDAISAVQAPGKALQGGYDERQIDHQTGALSPFDPRMVDDAANLASMVTPADAAATMAVPRVAAGSTAERLARPSGPFRNIPEAPAPRSVPKAPTPGIDDLYATKDAAYDFADKIGARYSADAIDGLSGEMIRRAARDKFNPELHRDTAAFLNGLGAQPESMSLTQLDQLRQIIRRDLVKPDGPDAHFGKQFISAIDDFIDTAGPGKITGVSGETANFAIRAARKANTTLRRAETVQEVIDNARLSAAASGSGGNIDNSIRQGFARILKSDKLSMGFSKDELEQMKHVVVGSKGQNALRLLGKLSPSGNGLMAALGLGATVTNPAMAIGPAAGMVAKTLSDRATQKSIDDLTRMVRTGGPEAIPIPARPGTPPSPKTSATLLEQNFSQKPLPLPITRPRLQLGA